MWIPDWLYERAPMLYVAIGAGCVLMLTHSPAASMSAALFVAAGALAFVMRRLHRQPVVAARPARRTTALPSRP